jgi:hypothetical protein
LLGSAESFFEGRELATQNSATFWVGKKLVCYTFGAMLAKKMQLGSIDEDFFVRADDLARLLKVSAAEISRLVRSAVLRRVADPRNGKAFLYPCLENVTRYVEFHRGKREAIHQEFLREKAGRERALRLRLEMENRKQAGELVDKGKLIARLEPVVIAYREHMLCRADRLERQVSILRGRHKKVAAIQGADREALGVLSDLFKAAGGGRNSSNGTKR